MENLELKYVISPNDSLSQQSLSASLKRLKTLLDNYKGLKIEIAGFATVTNQFKEVTSEAKKLRNELKAIKSMKVNIFGGSKNTNIAKQTSELKKLQKEITSSEAKMAKLNSELERSKSGRKLDAYKNSEINRLTNAKNKGDIGTQDYIELKRVIKSLNVDMDGLKKSQQDISAQISSTINKQKQLNVLKQEEAKIASQTAKNAKAQKDNVTSEQSLKMWKENVSQIVNSNVSKGLMSPEQASVFKSTIKSMTVDTNNLKSTQKQLTHEIKMTVEQQKALRAIENSVAKSSSARAAQTQRENNALKEQERITRKIAEFQALMTSKLQLSQKKYSGLIPSNEIDNIKKQLTSLNPANFANMGALNDKKASISNDFNVLTNRVMASKQAMDLTNKSATSLGEAIKTAGQKFGLWSIVTVAYYRTIQSFKQGIRVMKEMDTAMVDIERVTKGTAKAYDDFR